MRLKFALLIGAMFMLVAATATPASAATLTRGGKCKLIEVPAAAPVGVGSCPGVRPGALVQSDIGSCTFNFVFHGSDGRTYIGTAGHCIIEAPSTGGDFPEQKWAPGAGPVARDGEGNRIGEFAYAVLRDSDEADFALVRVDPGVEVDAQTCHFGGPTGINAEKPGAVPPTQLQHFGNGVGIGNVLPARSALALGMPSDAHVYAEGAVVPGDSGSGIESADGRAVGVIVTTGVHTAGIGTSGVDAGTVGVVRLNPMVNRAQAFTGTTYSLRQAAAL
ncbi:MAG: hypothetical protein H0V29_04295 [Thermoleophilaceae bacterium]|nr:hypothetical protein [Thermoleophilaceae bacterium]